MRLFVVHTGVLYKTAETDRYADAVCCVDSGGQNRRDADPTWKAVLLRGVRPADKHCRAEDYGALGTTHSSQLNRSCMEKGQSLESKEPCTRWVHINANLQIQLNDP